MKASVAASYNQYLQRQVDHYQRYLAATDAIGNDMEVAEARTRVAGDARAAAAIGLRVGERPSRQVITRVSCGRGERAADRLPGFPLLGGQERLRRVRRRPVTKPVRSNCWPR